MSFRISRSELLITIPPRKEIESYQSTIKNCKICNSVEKISINTACEKCRTINATKKRYYNSNIPIGYWLLSIDEKFEGPPILVEKYNEIVNNLSKVYKNGLSLCFAGNHGVGKQLSLDTELPTPDGFIKLSELKEGDSLFDEKGNICKVTQLHPINLSPESYKIEFDDGTIVEACAEHQWSAWDRKTRIIRGKYKNNKYNPEIVSTKGMYNNIRVGKSNAANYSIPCTKPINYPDKKLLIDPYVLGCWLGDGNNRNGYITTMDDEIIDNIVKAGYPAYATQYSLNDNSKACTYKIGGFVKGFRGQKTRLLTYQLKKLNLLRNKHIPDAYKYASFKQRLALVQGLMDTDGCCNKNGKQEFCSVNPILAQDFKQLICSLGIKAKVSKNKSFLYDKKCKDRYRINFTTMMPVFKLNRKLKNIREKKTQIARTAHRFIVNIELIESKPMRCITVDSPSNLFLITRSFIATHNTSVTTNILKKASVMGYNCLYTTLPDIVHMIISPQSYDKSVARQELLMVDFLVIDEFDPRFMGNTNSSDLYGRTLENIFRTRSQNTLPTFMCTNSPNVIESFSGPIKESIESLMNYVEIVPVLGNDFRKKNK
jgi:DNA replication protein DnaC